MARRCQRRAERGQQRRWHCQQRREPTPRRIRENSAPLVRERRNSHEFRYMEALQYQFGPAPLPLGAPPPLPPAAPPAFEPLVSRAVGVELT